MTAGCGKGGAVRGADCASMFIAAMASSRVSAAMRGAVCESSQRVVSS